MTARFPEAVALLDDAIAAGVAPGAQLSVRVRESGQWQRWDHVAGRLSYSSNAPEATPSTRYDLASVTKALVALALVRSAARGVIDLQAPIGKYIAEAAAPLSVRRIETLAAHRAELPAWQPFYQTVTPDQAERGGTRSAIIHRAARTPLEPTHGAERYSDIGYILLGEALARATGRALQDVVAAEVTEPLGLARRIVYRGVTAADRDPAIAPTERCPWRARVVQGNVHDENAYALEGVSGHAGLFGTAADIAEIGRAAVNALDGETGWFPPEAMRAMVAPRPGGSHRLGWDGKSEGHSSAGRRMSAATFGHLGFTGTSLWCDPHAGVVVALVSNRVHPTRSNNAIRALRPGLHDAVMCALAR